METAGDVTHLDGSRSVGERAPVADAFHRGGLLARLREVIRAHGGGRRDDLLEVRLREVVGDEGDALARERPHPTRVIEMVMAHHQVPDGLARQLADLRENRERPLVVEGRLDDDQVVLHLDHHAVMRAARHVPDGRRR